jgi:hypothetical protein
VFSLFFTRLKAQLSGELTLVLLPSDLLGLAENSISGERHEIVSSLWRL